VWKLIVVLGGLLLALETMVELGFDATLIGTGNGIFINSGSKTLANVKIVNTPMRATASVVRDCHILSDPHAEAGKVGTLRAGSSVMIVGKTEVKGEIWYQTLRFGGRVGYVAAEDLRLP